MGPIGEWIVCETFVHSSGNNENFNAIHFGVGPWATGRADWNPKGGLTGTRPVVDHYSITKFSPSEWCQRNSDLLAESKRTFHQSVM